MTHNIQSVFYDLLDPHNRIITSGSVEVDTNELIDEFRRAVYRTMKNNSPDRIDSIDLHVYPFNFDTQLVFCGYFNATHYFDVIQSVVLNYVRDGSVTLSAPSLSLAGQYQLDSIL